MAKELHCWKDLYEWAEETYGWGSERWAAIWGNGNATCMLPEGHEGPHEFTPNDQINITFSLQGAPDGEASEA